MTPLGWNQVHKSRDILDRRKKNKGRVYNDLSFYYNGVSYQLIESGKGGGYE